MVKVVDEDEVVTFLEDCVVGRGDWLGSVVVVVVNIVMKVVVVDVEVRSGVEVGSDVVKRGS